MTQDTLASERVTAGQSPAVSVRSDKHPDMEMNRYALDMTYEHGGSETPRSRTRKTPAGKRKTLDLSKKLLYKRLAISYKRG